MLKGLKNFSTDFLSKKKHLKPLAVICFLLLGGFFYYWFFYQTPVDDWERAFYSPGDQYQISQAGTMILVENKKAGISFLVPSEWRVERSEIANYIALYSPEAEGSARGGGMERGCEIIVETIFIKTDVETIKDRLEYIRQEWSAFSQYQEIMFQNKPALKSTASIPEIDFYGAGIHFPTKKLFLKPRLYYLGVSSKLEEKEACSRALDKFLEGVIIR